MTGITLCREPLCVPGRPMPGKWVLEGSDRGGQDKSRKVRPVGWVRDECNFKLPSNIASNPGNVPFAAMLSEHSSFDTFSQKQ